MTAAWMLHRLLRDLRRRPGRAVALAAAFAGVAVLLAAGVMLGRASTALSRHLRQEVHVIAYLHEEVDATKAKALEGLLLRLPGVAGVHAVGTAEALARLRAAAAPLGTNAPLGGLEEGFLPRSIEIALGPGDDLLARAADLKQRLTKVTGISAVDATTDTLARAESWQRAARALTRGLPIAALLFGLAAVLAVVGRARVARREEAEALALVGHTGLQIRLPAGLTGAAAGFVGALLGLALGTVGLRALLSMVLSAVAPLPPAPALAFAGAELALLLLAAAAGGAVAGLSSMPRARLDAR